VRLITAALWAVLTWVLLALLAGCTSDGRPHPITCATCAQALQICPGVVDQCLALGATPLCKEWEAVCVDPPPPPDDCGGTDDDPEQPIMIDGSRQDASITTATDQPAAARKGQQPERKRQ